MKTIYVLSTIILAVTANFALGCRIETDGCSSPVPSPFDKRFRNDCIHHDVCYRCVSIILSLIQSLLIEIFLCIRTLALWVKVELSILRGSNEPP